MTFNKTILSWIVILIITSAMYLFWQLGSINDPFNQSILMNVRLPRYFEALLTGMILTVSGLIFQTVLNNALADSFTLGLASGATFGSGLALFLGLTALWIPIFSVVFSFITLLIVLFITSILSRGYPIRILILCGLMVGALFNSLLYFLILLKPRQLNTIANYLFGGFGDAEYSNVTVITIVFIVGLCAIILILNQLKLLQLGELKSQSLGLNVQIITFIALCLASMMTAINVAYVGIIGFIGMIIPQLIKKWQWRQTLGRQLTLNCIIGGQTMVIADFIGSHVLSPIQIPASIIIALIGIPVLFYMLISQSKQLH
ncbi:TPA: FecCD family ABC transporter permease [Staphylococcus argenteus]|uniref:FecCD transport family protein n=2 Tax=Staphylococcus TaxID=1279 RepID=A0A7U7JTA2_9STAP|nr:iron ABC transporter permease [Staphylococcus argenteus]BBN30429.1 iron (Fe3+) ABC superfamily ATP binding cassette transporter, membrane protein [Staphylococcus aureus]ATY56242.1 iron ABC transporter permease [Staphylococcus argenteus]ATZ86484.1 iron ABC transporter permease [Staphylococcus argenteus]EKF1505091.1 iron ABC transporter permease [Staphylococcus argenteus]EYG93184.1 iron compound ABC transporter, permease [Staphylococcus argenteus]